MEQETVAYIIIISTITVLVFAIAIIILFGVFYRVKNRILTKNHNLRVIIKNKLEIFTDE